MVNDLTSSSRELADWSSHVGEIGSKRSKELKWAGVVAERGEKATEEGVGELVVALARQGERAACLMYCTGYLVHTVRVQ